MIQVPGPVFAQNTGGIFGPVVDEGHRSIEYRYAYDIENNLFAHRVHYQQSINDNLRWRVVAQRRDTFFGSEQHDFVQGELLWQMRDMKPGWQHAVRFDYRHSDSGRPDLFGLHWTHRVLLSSRWSTMFNVLTQTQVGGGREPGVLLQTRGDINYHHRDNVTLSLSQFNLYGFVDDIPGFSDQLHQLGPTLNLTFGDGWRVRAGYLAGLTSITPDSTFRFWLTKSL